MQFGPNGIAGYALELPHESQPPNILAPGILDQIMTDAQSNARHKIDAIRELRATAAGSDGDGPASQTEKFSIVINLGADRIERHEFDVTPNKPQLELNLEGDPNGNEWG